MVTVDRMKCRMIVNVKVFGIIIIVFGNDKLTFYLQIATFYVVLIAFKQLGMKIKTCFNDD